MGARKTQRGFDAAPACEIPGNVGPAAQVGVGLASRVSRVDHLFWLGRR